MLFAWMVNHYSVIQTNEKYLILKFNPNKTIIQNNQCSLFGFKVKSEKHFYSLLDRVVGMIKPQFFYLESNHLLIRLPKVDTNTTYFIFKDYKDSAKLTTLFQNNYSFAKFYRQDINNNVQIIKYGFLGLLKTRFKISNQDAEIDCYN